MKITMQEFEEFEKQFLFEKIKNPWYRLGQAFYNSYPAIADNLENDGDIGYNSANRLWNSSDRKEVLEIIDWYIVK